MARAYARRRLERWHTGPMLAVRLAAVVVALAAVAPAVRKRGRRG